MTRLFEIISNAGPLVISIMTFLYLLLIKVNSISSIERTLEKMDKSIEEKLDTICERQIDHEGRISHIEGAMNGKTR